MATNLQNCKIAKSQICNGAKLQKLFAIPRTSVAKATAAACSINLDYIDLKAGQNCFQVKDLVSEFKLMIMG